MASMRSGSRPVRTASQEPESVSSPTRAAIRYGSLSGNERRPRAVAAPRRLRRVPRDPRAVEEPLDRRAEPGRPGPDGDADRGLRVRDRRHRPRLEGARGSDGLLRWAARRLPRHRLPPDGHRHRPAGRLRGGARDGYARGGLVGLQGERRAGRVRRRHLLPVGSRPAAVQGREGVHRPSARMSELPLGRRRQSDVYVGALRGGKRGVPVDPVQLEEQARQAMTPEAFAYIAGGAGLEGTMRANREAFDRWRIVPRMLRDVSGGDISVELSGRRLPGPFLIAPLGVLEMAHRRADLAVAEAAAAEGVPMIFSNQASVSMERCAEAMGESPRWFQLYPATSNELVESFVSRAE